ncbi:UNKNOWN [Stylonychia lemnae]|uniref:Lipoprotein n=1 Tax=Stylonychia lemnae TaxID=5949 RepID=A0A078AKP2_STYLE|nr:UNKNOWN [Stylonychia lemnae]|eukprot:CDW82935.1 UNKNOWN [Stylonychia lemnae]
MMHKVRFSMNLLRISAKNHLLKMQLIFLLLIDLINLQTPTAEWMLDTSGSYAATSVANTYNGGAPSIFYDQGTLGVGATSRFVNNGIYFEGFNFACSHPPHGNVIRTDVSFSRGSGNMNERWCVGFDNGGLEVRMNYNNYNNGNNIQTNDLTGCQLAQGWNHITVTFTRQTCGFFSSCTAIACYAQTDAGGVTTDTASFNDQINDDPGNAAILCAGGTSASGFFGGSGAQDNFVGMINQIQIYSGTVLTAAQAAAQYSTNCQSYCRICQPTGTAPYQCIQQQSGTFQKYDFILPTYPVSFIHPDVSGQARNLAVNTNFAFTPAYAHNQGLFFDTTFAAQNQYLYSTGSTRLLTPQNSFTVEMWIRPTATPTSAMNLFERETSTNVDFFQFRFASATSMQLTMSGQSTSFNIGTVTLNEWNYVALHVVGVEQAESQICLKFNSVAMTCSNINSVLAETGTALTQIGDGFRGYIRNLYMHDYAIEELDLNRRLKTSGCTNNVNSQSCNRCPAETGQCISNCNSNQYVNSTTNGCTDCYASCRTCWAAYYDNCYSCIKSPGTWTFDYIKKCSSNCGDGIKDDYELCDDGNTKSSDGCSSTCSPETGFTCFGGSFSTADTCRPGCGNGVKSSSEGCDDGNNVSNDGCDAVCNIETGFTCTTGSPSVCTTTCGDGRRVGSEQCDDGNVVNNDGCSSTCTINTGYNCTGGNVIFKDTCQEICGDGKDYLKYGCEDGNTVNNDGCDQNCRVEVGFTCTGGSSAVKDTCTEICGDGRNFKLVANQCDDGNVASGDGCSSTCLVEAGFYCVGGSKYTKDKCQETCGDGKNYGTKACDDGNLVNGDGCHSDCTIEIGYSCSGGTTTTADTCSEVCGDGRNFGVYACDDGNNENGDGCDASCVVESGFLCSAGDPYTKSVCAQYCNGKRTFDEMCDDGNVLTGDGCDECCHREVGFTCTGGTPTTQDVCLEACGDGRKMNYLECDDGNQVSGDGCSNTCTVEAGWKCGGGTIFTPDICTEICGDGKNLGQFECDDGNVGANDGCSSSCYVEKGFKCSGGNATKADTCYEVCGDGKNMRTFLFECDDGNTVSGDGCAKNCTVESGFECTQGNYYSPDLCFEICGDGLNYGQFECDDGNNQDKDGCTAYCSVEDGYKCAGGSKTSADSCIALSNPSITSAYFQRGNKVITLIFNETIYMVSTWNLTNAWTLEMSGPFGRNNYQFWWNVTRSGNYKNPLFQGTKEIQIDFDCQTQLFGNKVDRVVINFNDKQYIKSFSQKTQMINSSAIVYPYGQDDTSAAGKTSGFPQLVDTLTYSLIYASFAVGFVGASFGYSMMDVWIMMNSLQQIYLFPSANLYVPSSLTDYVKNLNAAMPQSEMIGYLCFGGATNHTLLAETNPPATYTFEKMGYASTAFLETGADVLSIFVYFFVFSMITEIIRMGFEENRSLNNSLERLKSSMLPGYMSYAFMKLAFSSHLNLANLNFEDSQSTVSSLLAMMVGVGCWTYIIFIGYQAVQFFRDVKRMKTSNPELKDEEIRDRSYQRGNVYFQEYDMGGNFPVTLFYPCFMMFKQLILAILIVQNNTEQQLTGFMILNLMNMTAVLLIFPFHTKLLNAQLIFNEMAVFLVYMQAHIFIPKTSLVMSEQKSYARLLIMMILLIVGVNACFVIFSKVTQIVKCKSVARNKPNEIPENVKKPIKAENSKAKQPPQSARNLLQPPTSQQTLPRTAPQTRDGPNSAVNKAGPQVIKSGKTEPAVPIAQMKKPAPTQNPNNTRNNANASEYYDESASYYESGADQSFRSTDRPARR